MKNAKKIVMGGVAALALVTASVMGTMAYLQSSDSVNNTFIVGNVNITLDEAKTNDNGDGTVVVDAGRVKTNNYKLMPGHTYTKDPIIHVDADSEDCYLFVTVSDDIEDLEDETTVAEQIKANNWKVVESDEANHYTVYVYAEDEDSKTAVAGGTDVPVFANFKIQDNVSANELNHYSAGKTLTVNGYAIQKDGLEDKEVAEIWATLATSN